MFRAWTFLAWTATLCCTQAANAFVSEPRNVRAQEFSADAFLRELEKTATTSLEERTARFEEVEVELLADRIELECIFTDRARSRNFKIPLDGIKAQAGFGTSLLWTAGAMYEGGLPANLGQLEEVSYGGPPDDVYIWFSTSDFRLHTTTHGMAAEFGGGLIKCAVVRGRSYFN